MDKETIKKEWIRILSSLHREEWMDDQDFDDFINIIMNEIGGWDKLYFDIQTGINNGYTERQQFEIINKIVSTIKL